MNAASHLPDLSYLPVLSRAVIKRLMRPGGKCRRLR
jgi:hypothetical protein